MFLLALSATGQANLPWVHDEAWLDLGRALWRICNSLIAIAKLRYIHGGAAVAKIGYSFISAFATCL